MTRLLSCLLPLLFLAAASPAQFPTAISLQRGALGEAIARGDGPAVAAGAEAVAAMGGGMSAGSRARIAPFLDAATNARLAVRFDANAAPIIASKAAGEVPAGSRLIEGLAWDGARLFAGSVIDRRLLVRDRAGWRVVPLDGPVGGLFGMAVDKARGLLWIASGAADPMPDKASAFRGLIAVDLKTLRVARRIAVPDGTKGSPGDTTVGPDGSVYVSSGDTGWVMRCAPGCTTLEPLAELSSPQGMVADRGRLIVADYDQGIASIDPATRAVTWVTSATPVALDGIDGLVRVGDRFIGTQNGTSPRRIIAITLDSTRLCDLKILERANPAWTEPTMAAVANGQLIFVDGQWARYGDDGKPVDDGAARPTALRALPLKGVSRGL